MNSQSPSLLEKSSDTEELEQLPFTTHLIELRKRLMKCVGLILALFFVMLPFANHLYEMLSSPLRGRLPAHATMIATDVTATFMAPFKLNFYVALMIAMPFILYQIWQFLAPALYKNEMKIALPILFSSIVLFYAGIAFAYFVTLPAVLGFFMQASPDSVAPMTDINSYLSFCLKLFLVFGITFEIPVATIMLILGRFITIESLVTKRRYIIVGCFFIAMFVTPPDALSMLMLAVPMWLLFELGLLLGRILLRKTTEQA
ncbi:twin-arginine translocase subunit TatC [Acinetobacter sp. NIPH 2699]|uniref:twin-arginine translocase subunit TatC n=1 Tax=Acinetobacter sp. NIPH 2699 TaxID=2923433 RepID=UPI001F4C0DBA|nr:twin-arginine translocase subunit TatC [Acinetobacter sp. NIPH 2699]MCH7337750.1 twin-arginine translocase subunit TatC [Acinetobacter sp. NIPH 2699]